MADTPKDKTAQEQLKALQEVIREAGKLEEKYGDIESAAEALTVAIDRQAEVAKALLPHFSEKNKLTQEMVDKEAELLESRIKNGQLTQEQIKFEEAFLELKREMLDAGAAERAELRRQLEALVKIKQTRDKNLKNLDKSKKRLGDIAKRMGGILGIGNRLGDTMTGGILVAAKDIAIVLKESTLSMDNFADGAQKAALNMGDLGLGFLIGLAEEAAYAQDALRAEFVRSTGATREFSQSVVDASDEMREMGLNMDAAGAASTLMYRSVTAFRDATPEARKEAAVFVGTLTELGINGQAAAENMQLLTMGMDQSLDQAQETTKALRRFAISINMDVNQAMEDFNDLAPELLAHGGKMQKVFKNLAKTSINTGLSMQTLVDVASQFDTFEGAATAVGKLNGLLGGPYLNSIEMVYATEDERLKLMQRAMRASGRQFKDLSRYEKKSVAAAAGFKSVGDALYFFNKEAMDPQARKAHEDGIERQKSLTEAARDAKPAMERMQLAIMKLTVSLEPLLHWTVMFVETLAENKTAVKILVGVMGTLYAAAKAMAIFTTVTKWMATYSVACALAGKSTGLLGLALRGLRVAGILGVIAALGTLITMLIVGNSPSFLAILGMVTVAVLALNMAMNANPIGLIVLGVAAAIGALYMLFKHMGKVKAMIIGLFDTVASILKGIAKVMFQAMTSPINGAIWMLNKLISAANKVPFVNIPSIEYVTLDAVPGFANGVNNFTGGPAIVGERGPELVYLEKGTTVASNDKTVAAAREAMGVSRPAASSGGVSSEDLKAAFVAALKEVQGDSKITVEAPIELKIGDRTFDRRVVSVVVDNVFSTFPMGPLTTRGKRLKPGRS